MKNFKSFREVAEQTVKERRFRNIDNICKYGIEPLDRYLWWILENELVVIGAGSWIWKTELACSIAIENASIWKRVWLLSLEWDIWEIAYRYLQKHINLKLKKDGKFIKWPEYRLNLTDVSKYEDEALNEIPKEIEDNLKIFDKSFIPDKNQLLELIRDNYWNVDMFVIDHLHYLNHWDNEYTWISDIVRAIKEVTEIIKKPVVLVSHLSRWYANQNRLPNKSDLHWSSNIEKNANTVILLAPSDTETDFEESKASFLRWTKIIVDKNRTWMPTPAIFEATFDLNQKEYLSWDKYNYLSPEEQNRVTIHDKIF